MPFASKLQEKVGLGESESAKPVFTRKSKGQKKLTGATYVHPNFKRGDIEGDVERAWEERTAWVLKMREKKGEGAKGG